jgi:MoxR-like ATPase
LRMLRLQQAADPLDRVQQVMDCRTLQQVQTAVRCVSIEESLLHYLIEIIRATRSADSLEYGASPRGSLDLQIFSQATALLNGRNYVLPDDIKESARLVLPHRLIVKRGTRSVAMNARSVIDHIVESVPVPV